MAGTGQGWETIRREWDLPRYFAMMAYWEEFPPAHLQLRRIAQFLGVRLEAPKAVEQAAGQAEENSPQAVEQALGAMPTMRLPKILTPEEYLAQRKASS